jgi:hypothetical protein
MNLEGFLPIGLPAGFLRLQGSFLSYAGNLMRRIPMMKISYTSSEDFLEAKG